ncbi:MAG: ABC transporter ATP-binding protein [Thermoleophilia bacterium]
MTGGTAPALALSGVRASYGARVALDGIDLELPPGGLLALLGPNGAGKSTLVSLAAGLRGPDAGTVRVCGRDPRADRGARRLVGLAAQEIGLYPSLTVLQNIRGVGELYGMSPRAARESAEALIAPFGLEGVAGRAAGTLSGGERRRAHAAAALVHRPRLALLDEPTAGADPRTRDAILHAVREMAADGVAVVYTTHYLPEVERLDAEVVVLEAGRAVAAGAHREIVAPHGGSLEAAYLALTGRRAPEEWE